MGKRIVILQRRLPEYRLAFFEKLRTLLSARGMELTLVHGDPAPDETSRGDSGTLAWATPVRSRYVSVLGTRFALHSIPRSIWNRADLVIAPHESSYLSAYPLLARRVLGRQRVAFWGHGIDPGERTALGPRQIMKRFTTRLPDWWFAYTALSVERVASSGFPRERITCVNNAVDTSDLHQPGAGPTAAVDEIRRRLEIHGQNVAVFLGSLSPEKRFDFLLAACDLLRDRVREFHLVVVGDGPMMPFLRAATATRPWLHLVGARHGREKVAYCTTARVMVNPGMVGLNIVDSFALRIPLVTTDHPGHSPEIAYLAHGVNGLTTVQRIEEFAAAVASVLRDDALAGRLRAGCERDAARYTVDNMASAFAGGISAAVDAPPRRGPPRPAGRP